MEQTTNCNVLIEVVHPITSQADGKLYLPGERIRTDKYSAEQIIREGRAKRVSVGEIIALNKGTFIDYIKIIRIGYLRAILSVKGKEIMSLL